MYVAKPLCEVLYYLDFCWIMNVTGVCLLFLFIVLANDRVDATATIIPVGVRRNIFLAGFGIFVGPVFLASMVLPFVAFLFHDVNTMANLIIHLMPSMAMYNLRWHGTKLYETYPTFFNLQYLNEMASQGHGADGSPVGQLPFWAGIGRSSVAWNAGLVYLAWWIPYTVFMLTVGLRLPVQSMDKGRAPPKYDTVFHSLWRGGPCELVGTLLWNRPKEVSLDQSARSDFEVRDFILYMVGHAVACTAVGIGLVAGISYVGGQRAHAVMLLLATALCADRGAQRYTYYVTAMYGRKLRQAYGETTKGHKVTPQDGTDDQDTNKKWK
jgi:hypothetical protein